MGPWSWNAVEVNLNVAMLAASALRQRRPVASAARARVPRVREILI